MNKPRKHHFVPQFWIRLFASTNGELYGYDWKGDKTERRSSKSMMQIKDLYTIQPGGIDDTTLETTELGVIDSEGSAAFKLVLGGDRSEETKERLANFLAVQIMRDPEVIASYSPKAQAVALLLLEIFDAQDYADFAASWFDQTAGDCISKKEYTHITSLGLKRAEADIDNIITALETPGGMPQLPRADLIRNPDGLTVIVDKLLKLDWTLKFDPNAGFLLGDAGCLFDKGSLNSGLRVPLSKEHALYLTPSGKPTCGIKFSTIASYEVEAINLESAARARRWLVGEQPTLLQLKSQIGREKDFDL